MRLPIPRNLLLLVLGAAAALVSCATANPAPSSDPARIVEPTIEQTRIAQVIAPAALDTPAAATKPALAVSTPTEPARIQSREITIDLPQNTDALPSKSQVANPGPYTAFDFLQDYLTNRTYPTMVEGKPWTNGTLNVQQYQQDLGGVTYWDFFSEHENWDSPSYMWQDDDGEWRPYEIDRLKGAAGQELPAYLLLDRKGPGVMDKIWFTQDAIWMLETPQSTRDVGPIANMDDLIEWGNLDKLGNLRIEVDGVVAYDRPVIEWLSGKAWALSPELARILTWRHREYGSSGVILPVLYQSRLRIWIYGGTKKPKWFMATGVRLPQNARVTRYTGTLADLPAAEMARLARNVLEPDRFLETLGSIRDVDMTVQAPNASVVQFKGAGTLRALQFRVLKRDDPRRLWLKIRYGTELAVNLPLIAFFGDPKEVVTHRSTPLGLVPFKDGTNTEETYLFYSNFPLPFQNGLTIELSTSGATPVPITLRVAMSPETTPAQLWVDYREPERLKVYGPDYQVQLPGDGKLVGLVLASDDQGLDRIPKIMAPGKSNEEDLVKRAWPMGYLEGNLTLTDGAGHSRIFGGQEDWADGGFYFNRGYTAPPGGGNRPFGGILRYKDGKDGYATLFRYFNDLSAFRFQNGLSLSFGHGTWSNNFPVRYGTTVFYYRQLE